MMETKSILEQIPVELNPVERCLEVIRRVSTVGFQWETLAGPFAKIEEELRELRHELDQAGGPDSIGKNAKISPELRERIEEEIGDLFFCVLNLAFFLRIQPEKALGDMLARFEGRFLFLEAAIKKDGKKIDALSLDELDAYWNLAKKS